MSVMIILYFVHYNFYIYYNILYFLIVYYMTTENKRQTAYTAIWRNSCSSDDTQKIVASALYQNFLNYSNDYGVTWNKSNTIDIIYSNFTQTIIKLYCNADGSLFFLLIRTFDFNINMITYNIYKSINMIDWNIVNFDNIENINDSSLYITTENIVLFSYGKSLYKYNENTNIFDLFTTINDMEGNIISICCSDDLTQIYANTSSSYDIFNIYYTIDNGTNWNIYLNNYFAMFCNLDATIIFASVYNNLNTIFNISNKNNIISNKIYTLEVSQRYNDFWASRNLENIIFRNNNIIYNSTDLCETFNNNVLTSSYGNYIASVVYNQDISNVIVFLDYDYIYLRGGGDTPIPPDPPTPYDFVGSYVGSGVQTIVCKSGKKKIKNVSINLTIQKASDTSYVAIFEYSNFDCKYYINCFLKDNTLQSGNDGYYLFYVVNNVLTLSLTPPTSENGSVSTTTYVFANV